MKPCSGCGLKWCEGECYDTPDEEQRPLFVDPKNPPELRPENAKGWTHAE